MVFTSVDYDSEGAFSRCIGLMFFFVLSCNIARHSFAAMLFRSAPQASEKQTLAMRVSQRRRSILRVLTGGLDKIYRRRLIFEIKFRDFSALNMDKLLICLPLYCLCLLFGLIYMKFKYLILNLF